ncbi:MAG: hypothetical protein AAF688_07435 [Bacteroidota bacterium]
MREDDQKYREVISLNVQKINILFIERKKLTSTNRLSKVEIKKLTDRLAVENYPDLSDVELLTIIELQTDLDNQNTELLIDIVKKTGYPNENNTVCEKYAGMIFRHSQSKYFDEIKPLIEVELKKGNINKATYDFFIDHINGRPFDPRF